MAQWYWKWNRNAPKLLWVLVIIGLLASLPLAYYRERTETSAKKVEFTFDYRDLLEISDYRPAPQEFVNQQLEAMKKAGIRSLAVYEATLTELQLSRRITVYNAKDAATLTQQPLMPGENYTYVLFADEATRQKIQPMLEQGFKRFGVATAPWKFNNRAGLIIQMPMDQANLKPLGPDPMTLDSLKAKNFRIVARISNRHQPFVKEDMDQLLATFQAAGTKSIIIEGDQVPGYSLEGKSPDIEVFADLMKKHNMELAAVELVKAPAGIQTLAKELEYRVFRAHSFTESDADKLAGGFTTKDDLKNRILTASDRFVLAVKDRNIRMVFLNARASRNLDRGNVVDPLDSLYKALDGEDGEDGAIDRIEKAGFITNEGPAHSFDHAQSRMQKILKPLVILGSVAVIALALSYFVPSLSIGLLILGLLGVAGLYVLGRGGFSLKLVALGAGISAPSIAMMMAIRRIREKMDKPLQSRLGFVINLFIRTALISLIGALFVIGLLNGIQYNLLFDQFFGVKLLGLFPVVVVGLYLLLFSEELGRAGRMRKLKGILSSYISILWIVTAAVVVGALYYYISRTGNEGQVSPLEMMFRSFLQNTLGVRPRTKEFLIGYPLFFLGSYLSLKYRPSALYIFIFGVIGMVDMVGTFTHLHTPIVISLIRVGYGLLFGAVIGLLLIAVWELFARGWRKWAQPFTE